MLISLLLALLVFTSGFLAAHINWSKFLQEHLLNFDKFNHSESVSLFNSLTIYVGLLWYLLLEYSGRIFLFSSDSLQNLHLNSREKLLVSFN